MDTDAVRKHLEARKQQLNALIKHLESRGRDHPQYNQLENCKKEYELVTSQLQQLK